MKKVVVMFMVAVMAITMVACGDEGTGDSAPVDATVEQSGEETPDTEDVEASGETESEEPSDSQESQIGEVEEESSEAADGVVFPDNYDWASVDWTQEIGTMHSGDPMRVKQLLAVASLSQIQFREVEEFINENYMDYDSLDEESKAILDKLMELTVDELVNIQYNFLW